MSEDDQKKKSARWIPVALAAGVVVLWAGIGWWYPATYQGKDNGTFGDQFGSVNSLFAGLAFAGLIYTVWMQREELALQREELKLTRKEMEASTAAQGESASALKQQVMLSAMAAQISSSAVLLEMNLSEINNSTEKMPFLTGNKRKEEIDKIESFTTDNNMIRLRLMELRDRMYSMIPE